MLTFKQTSKKHAILLITLGVLIIAIACMTLFYTKTLAPIKPPFTGVATTVTKSVTPVTVAVLPFDMNRYSTTDPSSIWVIVNKAHPLSPINYTPSDLMNVHGGTVSAQMEPDLDTMIAAAKAKGVNLTLASSYRSYSYQVSLYSGYVRDNGQAAADTFSARAGYSEHQTGFAIDFGGTSEPSCTISDCYKDTIEGKWLAANATSYGFLLRYPPDKQSITGYESEPWHYRYIGTYLANEMKMRSVTTLEEFFGVSGGETYS